MFWAEAAATEVTSVVTMMPVTRTPRLKPVWRRINKAEGSPESRADDSPCAPFIDIFGFGRKYDLRVPGVRRDARWDRWFRRWRIPGEFRPFVSSRPFPWGTVHRPARHRQHGGHGESATDASVVNFALRCACPRWGGLSQKTDSRLALPTALPEEQISENISRVWMLRARWSSASAANSGSAARAMSWSFPEVRSTRDGSAKTQR